jgi:hypothetical protein
MSSSENEKTADLAIAPALSSTHVGSDVEENNAHGGVTKPVSRFTRWYRSPLFNVIIVGLISFTQPGIWNALNSMVLP